MAATLVALLLGIPVAIASALWPNSWLDRILSGWSALALGVPTFWLGILLILLFAVELHWLPSASGYVPIWEDPVGSLRNLALPAITLGLYVSAILARFLRASLMSELNADYVRTARSKGLPERQIFMRYGMRNAILPQVTSLAIYMGYMVAGSILVEVLFAYPGLGKVLVAAVDSRDYPVIEGVVLAMVVATAGALLIIDLLYPVIDPRIRYGRD